VSHLMTAAVTRTATAMTTPRNTHQTTTAVASLAWTRRCCLRQQQKQQWLHMQDPRTAAACVAPPGSSQAWVSLKRCLAC
jgi:hypothetical protein